MRLSIPHTFSCATLCTPCYSRATTRVLLYAHHVTLVLLLVCYSGRAHTFSCATPRTPCYSRHSCYYSCATLLCLWACYFYLCYPCYSCNSCLCSALYCYYSSLAYSTVQSCSHQSGIYMTNCQILMISRIIRYFGEHYIVLK